jgi:hypothetical protein
MTFDYWRPKIISARVLEEGQMLPCGYGVAWWLPFSDCAYCLPIPLNRVVGAFRAWWLQWRRPCDDDPIPIAYHHGHGLGYQEGERHGEERTHRLYAIAFRHEREHIAPQEAETT